MACLSRLVISMRSMVSSGRSALSEICSCKKPSVKLSDGALSNETACACASSATETRRWVMSKWVAASSGVT